MGRSRLRTSSTTLTIDLCLLVFLHHRELFDKLTLIFGRETPILQSLPIGRWKTLH